MITKPAVIRRSTSCSNLGGKNSKVVDKGIVLLKSGSRDFRVPSRMGKDSCGY